MNATKQLSITRNPFGFENKIKVDEGYKGVYNRNETIGEDGRIVLDEKGVMNDETFVSRVIKILKKQLSIDVNPKNVNFTVNTALPDTLDLFVNSFIDKNTGDVYKPASFVKACKSSKYNIFEAESRESLFKECEYSGKYLR